MVKMDLTEFMFIIGFLVTIAITLYKIYNAITGWQSYDFAGAIILFIGVVIAWGTVFFINIIEYANTLIQTLYLMATGLFVLNVVLLAIEGFNLITDVAGISNRKRYDTKENDRQRYNPRKAFRF